VNDLDALPANLRQRIRLADSGCWLWTGSKTRGYGNVGHKGRNVYAHRLTYELLVGPIPPGLELDHLCRTPACVRPSCLEPVTHAENMRRARVAECRRGHSMHDAHVLRSGPQAGRRNCRTCSLDRMRRYYAQRQQPGTGAVA